MTGTFKNIVLAAAAVGAFTLPAGAAMAASQTESALIGALLGGVAGAAVGKGKTEGVVLGAVAGAAIGAAVDSNDHKYRSRYVQPRSRSYYGNTRYGGYYAPRPDYRAPAYSYDRNGYGSSYDRGYDGYGYRR